jgi:PAS domain S-box-containing protein
MKLIHPHDVERVRAVAQESVEEARGWEAEFRVLWPDGSVHWMLSKATVILDEDHQPERMVGVSLDVTDRKHAEAALRESEERFRNMADKAPVMVWVSGADKLCTFFNAPWLDFTGRTMEQAVGNGWAADVHPEDLDRCLTDYSSSFDARRAFQMEYRLRRADAEYRWVLDNGTPLYRGGDFVGFIGSCVDITEQKLIEERLRASEARLMEA